MSESVNSGAAPAETDIEKLLRDISLHYGVFLTVELKGLLVEGVRKLVEAEKQEKQSGAAQWLSVRGSVFAELERLRAELSQARSGKLAVPQAEFDACTRRSNWGTSIQGDTELLASLLSRLVVEPPTP